MRIIIDKGIFSFPDPAVLTLSLLVIIMASTLVYIWASMREHRACSMILRGRRAREHFFGFVVGVSCTWLALFISLGIVILNLLKEGSGIGIVTYVMAGIVLVLGLVSNVYLDMFEFRIGFDVFRHRYAKTLMVEIGESINRRNRAKRSAG